MSLLETLQNTQLGVFLITLVIAMVPVVELRVAIPIGVGLGLGPWEALCAAVIGNMLPVPFLILFVRRIFAWLRRHFPRLDGILTHLEEKAHLKGRTVTKYKYFGLLIFVAIPLPGTGAWTGSLIAAVLDMSVKKSFPTIFGGVIIAGVLILTLTGMVSLLI